MATGVLTDTQYRRLVKALRAVLAEGKVRATQAAQEEVLATYWQLGRRLSQETWAEHAGYGEGVMEQLSADLGIAVDTLRRSIRFFAQYKQAPRGLHLSWSHYRELLTIPDTRERQWYERQAASNNWTRDRLVAALQRDAYRAGKARARVLRLPRPQDATYVYTAVVERVVDGDTLLLAIDLGFQVWKEQRVRLAGVDAPPLDTATGRQAATFVRERLARVEFVMVKTHQIDPYGRYLGHVMYALTPTDKATIFTHGHYLNQELLDEELARRV